MTSILHKFFLASAVAAAAALTATSALAEKVNVPFSFTANGQVCPAGYYSIGHDYITGMVTLQSAGRSFAWLASSGAAEPADDSVVLRFDKEGDHYTLQSVQYQNMIAARLDGKKHSTEAPSRMVLSQ